jgi:tetratricopeptide (TPR) repeat protein
MASKITNATELFHRFHQCEMQLRQGKIASCLIGFKEVIERSPAIPKTDKEKNELNQGIEFFLRNLAGHKKFQEIFGVISFVDTDLETNVEFINGLIVAQEEAIRERIRKDEEAADAQRLEMDRDNLKLQEEIQNKIQQAIALIDQEDLPPAWEIIGESEEIREGVALHYNDIGMQCRTDKSFAEAEKNYSKALMITPEDENLYYNMGRAYYESGDPEKAEKFLASAMKLNPAFREGQIFYDYLLKVNYPHLAQPDPHKKPEGFLKKIFHKK